MVITNNLVFVDRREPLYNDIKSYLVKVEDMRSRPLYSHTKRGLAFGRGLLFLLPGLSEGATDNTVPGLQYSISRDFEGYKSLLPGITLRDDQVTAIIKGLARRRGIFQLATGSGKSLCIAGIMRYLTQALGYCPPSILLEPTNYLVEEMRGRMESYGVPCRVYSTARGALEDNMLCISHPSSLCNDLEKNPELLSKVRVLIADESHHEHADTWSRIYAGCKSVDISLGFSGYLVNPVKISNMHYSFLSYDEAKAISCTGPVLMNLDTAYYIAQGVLATPMLIRMFNEANEPVNDPRDWGDLRKNRLESEKRMRLVAGTAEAFCKKGFKVLVLSSVKDFANRILLELDSRGLGKKSVCSFGGGEFVCCEKEGELKRSKETDYKEKFRNGEVGIMICTSHMFEGADIPNLDVVILAEVGKKARRIIQGVGRGLRRTKKGKYAYIVDFTDHCGGVLEHQSRQRMDCYASIIGVKMLLDYQSLDTLPEKIDMLENNGNQA